MEKLDKEYLLLPLIPLFLLMFSKPVISNPTRDKPGCFPDYRYPYGCQRFEKLP